ncbi:hypothetical protein C8Q80DRAFT_1198512 [Daedaleopsis nitida]|nr:hypothetical protein C8Q80DRAFT_1198512 [Daedaleopsis nitida]
MGAVLEYFLYIPFAIFSGTRTYALCRSWPMSALIVILSLAPVGINYTAFAMFQTPASDPIFGCGAIQTTTLSENIIFATVSRGSLIIADFLLALTTWRTLGRSSATGTFSLNQRHTSFVGVFIWNGTIYFVVLFILNVLHLSFTVSAIGEAGNASSELIRFTDPLTAILVYHFIIDLQEANEHNVKIGSDDPELQGSVDSAQGSISFVNRAIGSLGSTILPGTTDTNHDFEDSLPGDELDSNSCIQGVEDTSQNMRATSQEGDVEEELRLDDHVEASV